jgi:serine/threonine protein phosphatase PrpC
LTLRVRATGLSDVGQSRAHNEDSFNIDLEHGFFLVADGMGGHGNGEVASSLTVEAVSEFLRNSEADVASPLGSAPSISRTLRSAIEAGHDRVVEAVAEDQGLAGMGTTVVGLALGRESVSVAHVGDSRAYLLRDGTLHLVTEDHTWVNEQVRAGYLSQDQARSHPLKSVVTRAIGGEHCVDVDVQEIEVKSGDLFLLCSDGLTTMLSDAEIRTHLLESGDLDDCCAALVQHANDRGGVDNITVVLLDFETDDTSEEQSLPGESAPSP